MAEGHVELLPCTHRSLLPTVPEAIRGRGEKAAGVAGELDLPAPATRPPAVVEGDPD